MGARIRAHDWASTPVGPMEAWPQSLKVAVRLLLSSRHPMFIWWGPELIQFYNDAYAESLGPEKHPSALGARGRDTWPEIWDVIGPQIDQVMSGGEATWHEDQLVPIVRHGGTQNVWWTYGFGPIDDEAAPNGVGGVLVICRETTREVLARRETDERYRGLFEAVDAGFCVVEVEPDGPEGRVDYRVIEANPAFYRQTGFPESVRGRWLREAAPGLEEHWYETYARVARTGEPVRFEEGSDHLGRWFDVHAFRVGDPAQRRVAILFNDISSRRNAERELRESENRLRLVQAAARIGSFDKHAAAEAAVCSPEYLELYGLSGEPGRLTYAGWLARLHPDDRDRVDAEIRAAVADPARARLDQEFRVVRADDGRVRWIASRTELRRDADGRFARSIGAQWDVTERRAGEEALRELNETLEARVVARTAELAGSERRFRGIFDSALQFMALLEPDGTVIEVNRTALSWSGIGPEDIVGRPFWLGAPMRDDPALQAAVEAGVRRAAAGETVRAEHEMRGKGEVRAIVDFSLKPVPGPGGRPSWLVAEGRDITELKGAQEALRQAQKMDAVGQLAAGISHDFNNLLGAVVGSLDLIRRRSDDPDRVRRFAEAGLQAAERGAKLTSQLLAFSRSQGIELKALHVAALVDGMREMLAHTLGPMVRLRFDLDTVAMPVLSNPTQLELALLNLAINARDAMPDGGELTIATIPRTIENDPELEPGDYIELAVADTGTGMTPEVAARALDPFFTTKGVGKGTGLGLSQVFGLATQAGGTVRIETRPGAGTTVRVFLPKTDVGVEALVAAAEPKDAPAASAARVLVIDDDEDVRRTVAASLDALGYRVAEAADGAAGLAAVDAGPPDLVVVDFAMPDMNGAEVAAAIRERHPSLPIVFASGYSNTAAIEAAVGRDAPVLRKPFRIDELQDAVARSLRRDGASARRR